MSAQIIRMQAYKDYQNGLITKEEMLAGKVFREDPQIRRMWEQILARFTGDWSRVSHHPHCCCDKCAPTDEERFMKIRTHFHLNENGEE